MKVKKNKAVTINYTLKDNQQTVIDESNDNSFEYLHGYQGIVPGLEHSLENHLVGDKFSITVAPKDGYGERDESKIEQVPKDMFPKDEKIEPGMQFHAEGANQELITITILEVNDDHIKIDGNDPLAGETLHFDIEVVAIRDADETEILHGHIHNEGCHH